MNKSKSFFLLTVFCILLLIVACQKGKESQENKAAALQSAPVTEEHLNSFEGCLESGMLSQDSALASLKILVGGDHETIGYYNKFSQSKNNKLKGSGENWYQNDVCVAVKLLSKKKNAEAYDFILQIIEQKSKYPKALVCAIRAIMVYGKFEDGLWHGDKRSIPVLREIISNKDPEVRLNTAGALLSLGEGDMALPVIDELIKTGTQQSIPAIYKLFTPEEKEDGGRKIIVRSRTRLFDKRGKNILVRALSYSSDEVKGLTALRLVYMGTEHKRAENTATEILRQRTGDGRKGYRNMEERQREKNTINYAIEVLEIIASKDSEGVLEAFSESHKDRVVKERASLALKSIRQKNNSLD